MAQENAIAPGAATTTLVDEKKSQVTDTAVSPPLSDNGKGQEAGAQVGGNNRLTSGFFHWHEPGTSKEEKRLIFKLDFFLLSFSCLMFFLKQLDQNNVANAYVSGMAEQLGFGPGDELSWMNTYFLIGRSIPYPQC